MTKRLILYACWCGLMLITVLGSSYFAWSPFTDEKEDRSGSGSAARFHHK